MRYIQKHESPIFFEECKKNLPENAEWEHFEDNKELSQCKQKFKEHLLAEQANLCVYCERKIHLGFEPKDEQAKALPFIKSNCHIEHIMPKDKDSYPEMTFEYKNLTLSCNGDQCNPKQKEDFKPKDIHSCGHKKGKKFQSEHFLNPVEVQDIADFFVYDLTNCTIKSSDIDDIRAQKTIELLNLDNPRLNNERNNLHIYDKF